MTTYPPPQPDTPPRRVVSLIPSMTESLFDLGLGETLVGVTDYCPLPAAKQGVIPRLGGTKNARTGEIIALHPDLVILNQEENTPAIVRALEQAGLTLWLTFPRSVADALADLRHLAVLFHKPEILLSVEHLERQVEIARAASASAQPIRYFCPIWQDETPDGRRWWMTFNRKTYPHSLLSIFGGENVFAERERRYPLEADIGDAPAAPVEGHDTRYPRVALDEVRAAAPELILLPSEPYPFDETHRRELFTLLADTPAARTGRILLLDGSLITWHGTRLGKALAVLPSLLHPAASDGGRRP
ncbi:MAG: ABC transporter substrate-binding protein [Anaerolineae bacterium]|nr:MAG: ABC transporter substrate-binding protein [Anaerolineae bacterium]